jgi:two-component system response regulator (stage 0 sporulation protein F)
MDKDKKTILLAEDDAGNRLIIAEILEDMGYEVIAEAGGSSALSVIKRGVEIDLVITDYRMPDMSGLDLVVELRRILPDVPVIMMTAYGSIENYFKSMSLGVFEYVNKPIGKTEFERIVKKALRKPGRNADSLGSDSLEI